MNQQDPKFDSGMRIRREMLGPALAEERFEQATDFNRDFEDIMTRYCFGEVWARPGLDRATRSLLTIAILATQGRAAPLEVHVKGAITNGCTKEQIREVLLHTAIYAGVPAGAEGFGHAAAVLRELGLD
ncbi:MAG: carboxymuconolactone decarboxylase family protein [Steroidobacteraceae bacterium]|jgi:4-carboxymuconolactone decarboxylase